MLDILKKAQFCHDFNPIIQIYESHFGKILCLWPGSRFWLEYKKLNPNTPNPIADTEHNSARPAKFVWFPSKMKISVVVFKQKH